MSLELVIGWMDGFMLTCIGVLEEALSIAHAHSGKLIKSSNLIIRHRDLGRFVEEVIVPVIVAQSSYKGFHFL